MSSASSIGGIPSSVPSNGTLTISGGISGIYNGGAITNGTYSFPNSTGSIGLGSYSDTYAPYYDFTNKVLDLEKLSKMEPVKREMIFNLFLNFMNNENHNSKTIMYNTLESYNVIVEKKALDRKIKIDNVTKSEKTK
jgi:hypothetical protein